MDSAAAPNASAAVAGSAERKSRYARTPSEYAVHIMIDGGHREEVRFLRQLRGPLAYRREIVENWLRTAPYRGVIPVSATVTEMDLYLTDFSTVLELLRLEYGVDAADRDA